MSGHVISLWYKVCISLSNKNGEFFSADNIGNIVCCVHVTDDRSPISEHGTAADSPSSDSSDEDLLTLDSNQVYNCSAGQLITVVSASASASQSQ